MSPIRSVILIGRSARRAYPVSSRANKYRGVVCAGVVHRLEAGPDQPRGGEASREEQQEHEHTRRATRRLRGEEEEGEGGKKELSQGGGKINIEMRSPRVFSARVMFSHDPRRPFSLPSLVLSSHDHPVYNRAGARVSVHPGDCIDSASGQRKWNYKRWRIFSSNFNTREYYRRENIFIAS